MHSANGIHRINLTSYKCEEILPTIQLKNAVTVLKPIESKISPLNSRDIIPSGRQIYQTILTYNLHLTKAQELSLHAPLLFDYLYESEFESQLWMIFDSNKMCVGSGDAYSNNNYRKFDKGDYVIRLQVRHEKKDLLEKITELVMLAVIKLANPLALDVYYSYTNAITAGTKANAFSISTKTTSAIFVPPLLNEK